MCGIVGAVAQRDVAPILLEGLKRLEYRGYDSAGMAVLSLDNYKIQRIRAQGKVVKLEESLSATPLAGYTGIAHTRWATHGKPAEHNAHPFISGDSIILVHNGIIENHEHLRTKLSKAGYKFDSETDTEVVVHLIHQHLTKTKDLLIAVQKTLKELEGAFALGILSKTEPNRLIAARCGSPLVVGIGIGEMFIASDTLALIPVTQRFIYLQEGDIADITRDKVTIYDNHEKIVKRETHTLDTTKDVVQKGEYRHFMQKEIFEQPRAITETIEGRLSDDHVLDQCFGLDADKLFAKVQKIQIVACGTSYHAAMVGRYWLEALANLPCQVEIASEYRYRSLAVEQNTLFVSISQSGETADTLAAVRKAKQLPYLSNLTICNVADSSMARESDFTFMTRAGREIGVASTKAFTTQLVSLLLLTLALAHHRNGDRKKIAQLIKQLRHIPNQIEQALKLDKAIKAIATNFVAKQSVLFLGRGDQYPIAMEGALKLKELSYIHAEAYPAGELKHGPLALVDSHMPIVAIAPNDQLAHKLQSNLDEVKARDGQIYIFADPKLKISEDANTHIITMPSTDDVTSPIVYTIPLQLLAYHVAVLKGTDVDQPRNLAKSVTVE